MPASQEIDAATWRVAMDQLHPPVGVNGVALLRAFADVESSYGEDNVPRYEAAYGPGGAYYERRDPFTRLLTPGARQLRDLYSQWGALACCSWGPWQTMYVTAIEMGWADTPLKLWHDTAGACAIAATLLQKRIFPQVPNGANVQGALSAIADAWNSGSARDANIPLDYIQKFSFAYQKHLAALVQVHEGDK